MTTPLPGKPHLPPLPFAEASGYEKPRRGAFPKELLALRIREFREIFFKPYRIVYRIQKDVVFVVLIADGRRNMQELLERRLLEE